MDDVAIKLIEEFRELCKPEHINVIGNTALIYACENFMNDVTIKLIDEFNKLCKPRQIDNIDNSLLSGTHCIRMSNINNIVLNLPCKIIILLTGCYYIFHKIMQKK